MRAPSRSDATRPAARRSTSSRTLTVTSNRRGLPLPMGPLCQNAAMRPRGPAVALLILGFLAASAARGQANRIQHQRNLNLTGGACGNYLDRVNPNSAQDHPL